MRTFVIPLTDRRTDKPKSLTQKMENFKKQMWEKTPPPQKKKKDRIKQFLPREEVANFFYLIKKLI